MAGNGSKKNSWAVTVALTGSLLVLGVVVLVVSYVALVEEGGKDTSSSGCNASSSTSCSDSAVIVTVYVHEPGENGDPISAAQVVASSTGKGLGETSLHGLVDFSVPLSARSVSVRVLAENYLPRERVIELMPINDSISVKIALARRKSIPLYPDGEGYTLNFKQTNFVICANGFKKNGTLYNDLVMFDGMFMDPSDEGFVDMVDGDQFVLDGSYFALSFLTYTYFTDPEGNELQAESMNYYVEVDDPEQLDNEKFLVTYDQDSQQWENLGVLTRSNSLQKRQSLVFEQLGIRLSLFIGVAEINNINCWLQARTFDDIGTPILGFVITVQQEFTRNGATFLFRFGTSTGAAQTTVDGLFENAVCLPLECNKLDIGTVEANQALQSPRFPITPQEFSADTFNAFETGAPAVLGRFFTFQEVVTASQAGEARPFYRSVDECIATGVLSQSWADKSSYFYFSENVVQSVPDDSNCFIKIRINECLRSNANTIILVSSSSVTPTFLNVEYEELAEETFSAMHPIDECVEAQRVACIPYSCNSIIQATVLDDTVVNFCTISSFSPIVQSPLLSGDSDSQRLTIQTDILTTLDYNDADLGIYHDPIAMIAEGMCRDPTNVLGNTRNLSSSEGYAAIFNCVNVVNCAVRNTVDHIFKRIGETVNLTCSQECLLASQEDFSWRFIDTDGNIFYNFSDGIQLEKYSVNSNQMDPLFGQLTIRDVVRADRGRYECLYSTASKDVFLLDVHESPNIFLSRGGTNIRKPAPIGISCIASGYPRPSITWQKDGLSIPGNGDVSSIEITTESNMLTTSSDLRIARTQTADTGNYTCIATNSFPGNPTGTLSESALRFILVVGVPDAPVPVSSPEAGTTWVFLQWMPATDDGNSPITNFTISASPDINVTVEATTENNYSYNITEGIDPDTMYRFEMQVCNKIGCSDPVNFSSIETEPELNNPTTTVFPLPSGNTVTDPDPSEENELLDPAIIIGGFLGALCLLLVVILCVGSVLLRMKWKRMKRRSAVDISVLENDAYRTTYVMHSSSGHLQDNEAYGINDSIALQAQNYMDDGSNYAPAESSTTPWHPVPTADAEDSYECMYDYARTDSRFNPAETEQRAERDSPVYQSLRDNEEPAYSTITTGNMCNAAGDVCDTIHAEDSSAVYATIGAESQEAHAIPEDATPEDAIPEDATQADQRSVLEEVPPSDSKTPENRVEGDCVGLWERDAFAMVLNPAYSN